MVSVLEGKLKGGLERGRLFLEMKEYKSRIEKAAGFKPFEGTLILEVDEKKLASFLKQLKEKKIAGFELENCVYGALVLYRIECMGGKAAIIKPAKTVHPLKIIEVIAPFKLREKFGLKDGDKVKIGVVE